MEALWHSIVNVGIVIAAFANPCNAWDYIDAAEDCIDSYSLDICIAQIEIIAAMLMWLSMAWRKVFRKLELEEEVKQNET